MKTCKWCNKAKLIEQFSRHSKMADGRLNKCKACERVYRDANRQHIADRTRQYRAVRADLIAEKQRQRLASNPPCLIDGCLNRATAKLADSLCQKHERRMKVTGEIGPAGFLDISGPNSWEWTGDECTYNAAHLRLRAARGKAKDQACVDCDNPAAEWSYSGGSDKELTGEVTLPRGRTVTVAYSPDPADYDPRCKSCHTKFDANRKLVSA